MVNYAIVMRAYPQEYRSQHGAEFVATANELADGRWSSRQARSLLANGVSTRARLATNGSARSIWAQGVVTTFGVSQVLNAGLSLSLIVNPRLGFERSTIDPRYLLAWSIAAIALLITNVRRSTALLLGAGSLVFAATTEGVLPSVVQAAVLAPVLLWAVKSSSAERAFSPIVGVFLLGLTLAYVFAARHEPDLGLLMMVLGAGLLFGLAAVAVDPRPFAFATVGLGSIATFMVVEVSLDGLGHDGLTIALSHMVAFLISVPIGVLGIRRLTTSPP